MKDWKENNFNLFVFILIVTQKTQQHPEKIQTQTQNIRLTGSIE